MSAFATLPAFVAHLQQAEVVPRPDGEPWGAMIARISAVGTVAAIEEDIFWYFLECLPPKYLPGGGLFAFAEGEEALRIFWKKNGRHFCRPLTWDETTEFCRLACIALPS